MRRGCQARRQAGSGSRIGRLRRTASAEPRALRASRCTFVSRRRIGPDANVRRFRRGDVRRPTSAAAVDWAHPCHICTTDGLWRVLDCKRASSAVAKRWSLRPRTRKCKSLIGLPSVLDRTRVSDVQGSRIATNSTSISCERNQEQRGTFESFHWIFERLRLRSGRSALVGLSAGQFGICPCLQLTSTTASACGLWAQHGIQGAHGNLGGVLSRTLAARGRPEGAPPGRAQAPSRRRAP
jgi:hypothetical protein